METMHERLNAILKELGVTPYKLARDAGEKPTKLYNILSGKAKPSYGTIESLVGKYPQINLNWLVNGEGEMFYNFESNAKLLNNDRESSYIEYPMVTVKFQGSFVEQYTGDCSRFKGMEPYQVYSTSGKIYKDAVVIEVEGSSMSPRLVNGTKVLATCIDHSDWCYQSNGIYAIMYKDYFVVKRIKDNDLLTKNILVLHSDNPEAGSMPVQAKDIRGMWKVVSIVESPIE